MENMKSEKHLTDNCVRRVGDPSAVDENMLISRRESH